MQERADVHLDPILKGAGVYTCVECGKCVSACPMQEMYPSFSIEISPRGIIKKALFFRDIVSDESIWYCTECNACTETCPEGVSCRNMIRDLKKLALEKGLIKNAKTCKSCGAFYAPLPVLDYLNHRLKGMLFHGLNLCPPCRRQVYLRRNA